MQSVAVVTFCDATVVAAADSASDVDVVAAAAGTDIEVRLLTLRMEFLENKSLTVLRSC
jgi:hypothetical protein